MKEIQKTKRSRSNQRMLHVARTMFQKLIQIPVGLFSNFLFHKKYEKIYFESNLISTINDDQSIFNRAATFQLVESIPKNHVRFLLRANDF